MSLTYTSYVTTITQLLVVSPADPDFVEILPSIIDYAEGRCYRELNLLSTVVRNSSSALTPNARTFTLPTNLGTYSTVTEVNVITPSGSSVAAGTRNSTARVSLKFLDFLFKTESAPSTPSVPGYFAMVNAASIAVGPAPDAAYVTEVVGTIVPVPLSSGNTTTYLTTYLPDLFVAASMVFASGWQKNFGSQADDPKMGQSWETQYQTLFASANAQQNRLRFSQIMNSNVPVAPA